MLFAKVLQIQPTSIRNFWLKVFLGTVPFFGESNLSGKPNVRKMSDTEFEMSFASSQAGQYMRGSC